MKETGHHAHRAAPSAQALKQGSRRKLRCARQPKRARVQHVRRCESCGQLFMSRRENTKLCAACRREKYGRRNAGENITPTTAYLAQKWQNEGMRTFDIALILGRSRETIDEALSITLPESDYARMQAYYCAYDNRRKVSGFILTRSREGQKTAAAANM